MIEQTELARAAGFFNGEGCIYVDYVDRYCYIRLAISNTHFENLEQFNAALGDIGKISKDQWDKTSNKPKRTLKISNSKKIEGVMEKLWPWLSTEKRNQYLTKWNIFQGHRTTLVNNVVDCESDYNVPGFLRKLG